METYDVEYTDTFHGEANYSWARRATITVKANASQGHIVKVARRAVNAGGGRTKTEKLGGHYTVKFAGSATIMFILFKDAA